MAGYKILWSTCVYVGPMGQGGLDHQKKFSSLFQRQSCAIMKGGADQVGSLSSVLLLAVPEAVLSHKKGESVPPGPSIARPCRVPQCSAKG